jgi:hypothetical protein
MDENEIDTGRCFLWGCLPIFMMAVFLIRLLNRKGGGHKNPPATQK